MISFDQLQNAPECKTTKEIVEHIMKGLSVVRLPRRKLRDICGPIGFYGDAWILPSKNEIQTEAGNYLMPPNVFWRITAMCPELAPIYELCGDIEVTPLFFEATLREKFIFINFPVEIQENTFVNIHKTQNKNTKKKDDNIALFEKICKLIYW